jgi:hypothetical protein
MSRLCLAFSLLVCFAVTPLAVAQSSESYVVPRTEHGQPDFRGVWVTEFLTMFERPAGVPSLVASPEMAKGLVAAIRGGIANSGVIDPDVFLHDIAQLTKVKGEYRTSIIVDPEDGQFPYSEAGLELLAWVMKRNDEMFDTASQRPMVERCMESFGYPPMHVIPYFSPRQIFQNRDHLVMLTEDASGLRIIRLAGEPPPKALRSVEGYSIGHWEGDTLVVETSNLRDEDPSRLVIGRPPLHSRNTRFEERFTRVSETELFYRVTVEDEGIYTQPWTGEFSLTLHDGPIYEYACHEGNYSLPNSLSGGRFNDAQRDAAKSAD